MIKNYSELGLQLNYPSSCEIINKKDYFQYNIFEQGVPILEVLKIENSPNLIMFLNFDDEPDFIKELNLHIKSVETDIKLANKNNVNWKSLFLFNPIYHKMINIEKSKVFVTLTESPDTDETVVMQVYFNFKSKTLSINVTLNKQENVEDYFKTKEYSIICEVIKNAKKIAIA